MFLGAIPAFWIPAGGNFVLVRRVALAARRQVLRFALRRVVPVPHVGIHVDGVPMNMSRIGARQGEWFSNRSLHGMAGAGRAMGESQNFSVVIEIDLASKSPTWRGASQARP